MDNYLKVIREVSKEIEKLEFLINVECRTLKNSETVKNLLADHITILSERVRTLRKEAIKRKEGEMLYTKTRREVLR